MSSDKTPDRREIEDTTAARLAEIVAGAERAAKRVIDEAEAEARERLAGAEAEAERIVAERLATLAGLTDEVDRHAQGLKRGAEALQRALADVRAEAGEPEAPGGSTSMRGGEAPTTRRGSSPSLTVVGRSPAEPADLPVREAPSGETSGEARDVDENGAPSPDPVEDAAAKTWSPDTARNGTVQDVAASAADGAAQDGPEAFGNGDATPAGARLLATQMAVSGSSRAEIEARLRNGFAIADTAPILDAILGPEK